MDDIDHISCLDVLDNLYDGIYYVNIEKKIVFWNKAAEKITGYSKAEVVNKRCSDNILQHVDDSGRELCICGCPLAKVIQDGVPREATVYLHHKQGHRVPVIVKITPIYNANQKIVGAVELFSDASTTMNVVREIAILRREVFIDQLTGIGNRKFADMNLRNLFENQNFYGIGFGILFIDIDNFKHINDDYGHEIGDRVLVMVAKTIASSLRQPDIVARWGGEEFIIMIPKIPENKLLEIAERVRVLVEKTWLDIEEKTISVTVSVGGTMYQETDNMSTLINRADKNMYLSKKAGKNCISIDHQPLETTQNQIKFNQESFQQWH
jgi:diguanylate cyclase (GGDEF)-like protein/PAS domain S-box-containing protein